MPSGSGGEAKKRIILKLVSQRSAGHTRAVETRWPPACAASVTLKLALLLQLLRAAAHSVGIEPKFTHWQNSLSCDSSSLVYIITSKPLINNTTAIRNGN
jgi:hypothetical protein